MRATKNETIKSNYNRKKRERTKLEKGYQVAKRGEKAKNSREGDRKQRERKREKIAKEKNKRRHESIRKQRKI